MCDLASTQSGPVPQTVTRGKARQAQIRSGIIITGYHANHAVRRGRLACCHASPPPPCLLTARRMRTRTGRRHESRHRVQTCHHYAWEPACGWLAGWSKSRVPRSSEACRTPRSAGAAPGWRHPAAAVRPPTARRLARSPVARRPGTCDAGAGLL
jgi:hypothetical protein